VSCPTPGVTIFLTTQYLEEADQLADRIAVLDQGRIVAEGTTEELKRRIPGGHIRLQFPHAEAMWAAASSLAAPTSPDEQTLTVQVPSDGSLGALRSLLDRVDRLELPLTGLSVHTPDLDDVFLTLTGRPSAATAETDR
jgi:ABC-2 type transport system ATP-binding protein